MYRLTPRSARCQHPSLKTQLERYRPPRKCYRPSEARGVPGPVLQSTASCGNHNNETYSKRTDGGVSVFGGDSYHFQCPGRATLSSLFSSPSSCDRVPCACRGGHSGTGAIFHGTRVVFQNPLEYFLVVFGGGLKIYAIDGTLHRYEPFFYPRNKKLPSYCPYHKISHHC